MEPVVVYITASSVDEAKRIGRALVEERLAACANVLPGVTSIYWWQDAVQEEPEAAMVAKTRKALVKKVIDRVRRMHSYDCPCVVAMPITKGNPDFLDWIIKETS